MSLDTLLEIGRIFRESEAGLKHHRYIKLAPQKPVQIEGKKARSVVVSYFTVPARADGSFDFAEHRVLDDEDAIRRLFYLNFKTSEADSYKKYIFGDVLRLVDEKTKKDSGGNFVMGDEAKTGLYAQNSFVRGELEMGSIEDATIANFRQSFKDQMPQIKEFLAAHPQSYLHFDFEGKAWWQLEAPMRVLNEKLLADIVARRDDGSFVLQKYLYKALAMDSGRIPGLSIQHAHKCRTFASVEEVMNLVYVLDFSTKPIIRKGDVKIIVLPRGRNLFKNKDANLAARVIEKFFDSKTFGSSDAEIETAEDEFAKKNAPLKTGRIFDDPDDDEDFPMAAKDVDELIEEYDFIFSKAGGVSSPDVDMVEVSGLQRSLLRQLSQNVRQIKDRVLDERARALYFIDKKKLPSLSIGFCFSRVLGDKKRFESHLFKVLPQIYTGTYFDDKILLPSLLERTEYNIRSIKPKYELDYVRLRWDFMFLLRIRNGQKIKEEHLMTIKESPSYRVGFALGELANQFRGSDSPIKSFEKRYVGYLSRRITKLPDVIQFGDELNQMLARHENKQHVPLTQFTWKNSNEFTDAVHTLETSKARYDKNECAFGFFEGYYASRSKADSGKAVSETDETQTDEMAAA